jgi:ketosteroid isomerase-like protein
MSENLDLVRSIYADWERGDYTSVAWADPEMEYVTADGPAPGRSEGVAAMAASWRDYLNVWEEHRSAAEEYREIDDARVLVLAHTSGGRGKGSGLELGHHGGGGATLFTIRAARVARLVVYWDRDRALADLRLTREEGSPDS